MKQKSKSFWLLATLLCGMSLTAGSCKDDANDSSDSNLTEEQADELQQQQNMAYAVIDYLADTDEAGDDFLTQSFDPAIGVEDSDDGTRIVYANTMEAAAERFADLAQAAIDENTPSYTWSNPLVGTMTYTKSQDGKSWATVDVDIRQVPHLRRIVYRNAEQADDNAEFAGCAYYRFGDVISRDVQNKDGSTTKEYWVCVRPAFGPEKKEDSHWVCLNALPQYNTASYTYTFDAKKPTSRTQTWYVPTHLGKNNLHMQNLAEMLYAMLNPMEWQANVRSEDKPKLKMFNDFSRKRWKLHNQYFWRNVCEKWDEEIYEDADGEKTTLWNLVFNTSKMFVKDAVNKEDNGLRLLHDGYKWWWNTSWYCKLWETVYTYGTGNQSNMHSVSGVITHEKSMENIKVDCRVMGTKGIRNYMDYFDDTKTRWYIRHATGQDLTQKGSKYNKYSRIAGTTDVYRYYRDVNKIDSGDLINTDPEETDGMKPNYKDGIDYASNAPAEGVGGTYMIGDVLEDEDGGRWFCLLGSPHHNKQIPGVSDNTAWFVSFDHDVDNGVAEISEGELPETAFRFITLISSLETITTIDSENKNDQNPYRLDLTTDKLGRIGQHILDYAKVDLRKLFVPIDSTWKFVNYAKQEEFSSHSLSYVTNFAYRANADRGNNSIARLVYDRTQAGDYRGECQDKDGKVRHDWRVLCYKHYEEYIPGEIMLTESEKSIHMTPWQALWPITTDRMALEDAASQAMVNKYAPQDKWQKTNRRTAAEASVKKADYYWKDGDFATGKRSIFNEPVLYFRVLKIKDEGGKLPNLLAQDGTRLKIVHLQNDANLYEHFNQAYWLYWYAPASQSYFYLDNMPLKLPKIAGVPEEFYNAE